MRLGRKGKKTIEKYNREKAITGDELSAANAEVRVGGVLTEEGFKGLEAKWKEKEGIDKRKMKLS